MFLNSVCVNIVRKKNYEIDLYGKNWIKVVNDY